MPKSMIHISFIFLTLTALTGVWMRLIILSPDLAITSFSYILHGHSHMAILGWTFLAGFLIFLQLIWHDLKNKKQAIAIILAACITTILMFIAFLLQGYATYSIIFSTAHIGIEYWMAIFMYRQIRSRVDIPQYSRLFIKGAIVSLVISTFGPFLLGGLAMAGLKETPFFDMAIYFYLHFQYNGWLYLLLFGLFLFFLHKKNIALQQNLINWSFWVYMISLLPAYTLSVLWYGLGSIGMFLAILGELGQLTAIILLFIGLFKQRYAIRTQFSSHIVVSLCFTFLLLFCKSMMEFGLLYNPLAILIFETRSVVIGYLHLTLLGFISIFLLTQYQMVGLLQETKKTVLYGIGVFILGFTLNEILLFSQGLTIWLHKAYYFPNQLLFVASVILLIGIIIIWCSLGKDNKKRLPSMYESQELD